MVGPDDAQRVECRARADGRVAGQLCSRDLALVALDLKVRAGLGDGRIMAGPQTGSRCRLATIGTGETGRRGFAGPCNEQCTEGCNG